MVFKFPRPKQEQGLTTDDPALCRHPKEARCRNDYILGGETVKEEYCGRCGKTMKMPAPMKGGYV